MTWNDVKQKYPRLYNGGLSRESLTEEQEREFVEDCYSAYENGGFANTFGTPYTGEKHLVGKRYKVIGRVPEYKDSPNGTDLECLPMWFIRFEDGFEMAAYPEEICLDERNK